MARILLLLFGGKWGIRVIGYLFQVGTIERSDFLKVHCFVMLGFLEILFTHQVVLGICLKPTSVLGAEGTYVYKRILPFKNVLLLSYLIFKTTMI